MMTCFGLKHENTPERLISACRWLEEIPIAKSQDVLSKSDTAAIANAANAVTKSLGYDLELQRRILNAVLRVKSESSKEYFGRLADLLRRKYGADIVPDSFLNHLVRAMNFRGQSAHGWTTLKDTTDVNAFIECTRAIEALCYLLMAVDLPISTSGLRRIRSNPLVRDYIHSL